MYLDGNAHISYHSFLALVDRSVIQLSAIEMAHKHQFGLKIVYLASPYTHPNLEIRKSRFEAATKTAAKMIREGRIVYSPITMTHPIDIELAGEGDTLGSDYWVAFDEAFMDVCSEIAVLRLDGWEHSHGVAREIEYFKARGRPVIFIDPA